MALIGMSFVIIFVSIRLCLVTGFDCNYGYVSSNGISCEGMYMIFYVLLILFGR